MAFLLHSNVVPDVVAFVGFLVFCAGAHLLWQARDDMFFWLAEFTRVFAAGLRTSANPPAAGNLATPAEPARRKGAAKIALGFLLVFLVAPALIVLGLAF